MAAKRRPSGVRPRRVPQRTCVACRQVEGKRGLIRIVRTPEGSVVVDPTGKRNGRGAYLHASRACWDLALRRRALQHALKAEISEDDRSALTTFRDGLPADTAVEPNEATEKQTIETSDESMVTQA
jgi:uncharacterized protein